ncbi:MAG TPA: hypothetical protein VMZ53_13685, partial [Kofleriaceae bacterium]|nr:hypothetical protein [Kofleriaceae bacterium]
DADNDDAEEAAGQVAMKEPRRPSQRSFTTSDEGDKTPLPPPTAHDDEDSKPGDAPKFADPPSDADANAKDSKEAQS